MRLKSLTRLFFLLLIMILLSACNAINITPARSVEIYYQALADKDETQLVTQSCSEWEPTALLEYDSFRNVETELKDVNCQVVQDDDNTATVRCEGVLSASYGGEIREFPLSDREFTVVLEGGEWRLCGYE